MPITQRARRLCGANKTAEITGKNPDERNQKKKSPGKKRPTFPCCMHPVDFEPDIAYPDIGGSKIGINQMENGS
jgi:hypothetical protein